MTEVEGKKNVQDTASADDKRDMFMQIIQMTFTSHEAAYDFYNSYARDNGFSIRKNKVRYRKAESHHMRYRQFICSRQGKRDSRLLTEEGHIRRLRPETRCHRNAHLTVKKDKKRGNILKNLKNRPKTNGSLMTFLVTFLPVFGSVCLLF